MKKMIGLFLATMFLLAITGCTNAEKAVALETSYAITKKGVQTFVSDEKREKLHTKALDEVIGTAYGNIKKVKLKDKE